MKTKSLKIGEAHALMKTIEALSKPGEDGGPKFRLPSRFNYACMRTQKKLYEAWEPIQKTEIREIWGEWQEGLREKLQAKIDSAKNEADKKTAQAEFDAELKRRSDLWKEKSDEMIEVEIYEFPRFRDSEIDLIDQAGFTPIDFEIFALMGLEFDSEVA